MTSLQRGLHHHSYPNLYQESKPILIMILYITVIYVYATVECFVCFFKGGGITDCLKAVLLLQEVAKTAHEAGKRITSNRPWMLSDNVMGFFF